MTTPTARVIASIWITVALVSGLVILSSIHEADCSKQFRAALAERRAHPLPELTCGK